VPGEQSSLKTSVGLPIYAVCTGSFRIAFDSASLDEHRFCACVAVTLVMSDSFVLRWFA